MLIVDDEESIRWALQELFMQDGWEVHCAEDAEEASRMIKQNTYDFMITDLKMPGRSGVEIVREARERNPHIGVIVLTGYASLETATESLRLGVWDYLTKPCRVHDLKRRIDEFFQRAATRRLVSSLWSPLGDDDITRFLEGAGTEILTPSAVGAGDDGTEALGALCSALADVGFSKERTAEIIQPLIEGAAALDAGSAGKWRAGLLKGHVVASLTVLDDHYGVRCEGVLEKLNETFDVNARMVRSGGVSSVVVSEAVANEGP
jgi:CheY-like chemotaxis protein